MKGAILVSARGWQNTIDNPHTILYTFRQFLRTVLRTSDPYTDTIDTWHLERTSHLQRAPTDRKRKGLQLAIKHVQYEHSEVMQCATRLA
jgi:hypothetical protein